MQISTLTHQRGPKVLPKKQAHKSESQAPKDSFFRSASSKAVDVLKSVGKTAKRYVKPALVAAAPAAATVVAAALGGVPAAALAMVGSTLVGSIAGTAVWGPEIGYIKGFAAGGLAAMSSALLGAVGAASGGVAGSAIALTNLAAIGATREVILRHLADVPKK